VSVKASCRGDANCACDACRGIHDETPLAIDNRPGLSAVRYRVGDHARFKASLLAGISRAALPALRELTTRRDDDFSIALFDAFAVMADVLTFYEERIANESYLRTATERLSIGHIARLIGYELRPGSAANVSLAFTMQEGVGAVERLRLPIGTRVQSTPGPDEKAQVFETVEEIEVRPAWNRISARAVQEQELGLGTAQLRLKGGAANVRPGDGFLLTFPTAGGGDFTAVFRRVLSVQMEPQGRWTDVSLGASLATATFNGLTPLQTGAFVFRKHASLFGYNAPDFKTLDESKKTPTGNADWTPVFPNSFAPDLVFLDGVYREVVAGTWGIWQRDGGAGSPLIFNVTTAGEFGLSLYALAAKATYLVIQRGNGVSTSIVPGAFWELRATSVLVQAEKLELADIPVVFPVMGNTVALAEKVDGLEPGRAVAVQGKQLRAEVKKPVKLFLWTGAGWIQKDLVAGARLDLLFFPIPIQDGAFTWFVVIEDGLFGLILALPGQVRFRNDEDGVELGTIASVAADGKSLTLDAPLARRYDPPTVTLNANVAGGTHGETVKEVFEGGDAARTFQRFALKQTPLTYVAATTPSGVSSTLRVWVDEVEWHEVPWLYGRGPKDRVFITRQDGEGKTWIQFGDGVTGGRLPTGQRNVRAEYRRGIGAAGIVKPKQIDLLLTRPAGLKEVVNPLASADGKDPEVLEDARQNAPLTVLTLDRVVSLQDYEDFARGFAGIYKARATWTWFSHTRGVFLTVAGFEGGDVSVAGRQKLKAALAEWGDPFVPVAVANHEAVTFRAGLRVKVDPDRVAATVLAAVDEEMRRSFSFAARAFGQSVALAEVTAAAQRAPGVVAVQVAALYRTGDADHEEGLAGRLVARAPQPGERGVVLPAQLLTLHRAPLDLLVEMA
jgi:hypothetical protein